MQLHCLDEVAQELFLLPIISCCAMIACFRCAIGVNAPALSANGGSG
jgi:hypothetical protein